MTIYAVTGATGQLGALALDHLLGKVFVEYLSPLKRNRIKARLLKEEREHKREAAPALR